MKKLSLVLAAASLITMFSAASASAEDVLHTGVRAYINGSAIESFTINNHTVVSTEDIDDYGFRVDWDANSRALYISRDAYDGAAWNKQTNVLNYEAYNGMTVYNTVPTDIKVYIAGQQVQAYAVNKGTYKNGTLNRPIAVNKVWASGRVTLPNVGTEMYINIRDLVKATSEDWNIEHQWFADQKLSLLSIENTWPRFLPLEPGAAMQAPTFVPFAHLTYDRAFEIANWAVNNSLLDGYAVAVSTPVDYHYVDQENLNFDKTTGVPTFVGPINGLEFYDFNLVMPGYYTAEGTISHGAFPVIRVFQNGGYDFINVPNYIPWSIVNVG